MPAVISAVTTVVVFFLTVFTKNYFEKRILSSKLETEHKFEQKKEIKRVLAKYKIHLLNSCEEMNHRLWNFSVNYHRQWIVANGSYRDENYFFHSTLYRVLSIFAWVEKIKREMIFLDTTIASKQDLEFIKFLKVLPLAFCDLTTLEGSNVDGSVEVDHFFRTKFELYPLSIISSDGVASYSEFKMKLPDLQTDLAGLFGYFDGISPSEERKRWDRLQLFHLIIVTFLNYFGYDFQKTKSPAIRKLINQPRSSIYMDKYFDLFAVFNLDDNREVKKVRACIKKGQKLY